MSEPKQIIIIRKDLNMRKGKMVAQGAHASMKAILGADEIYNRLCKTSRISNNSDSPYMNNDVLSIWLNGNFTKICVSVDSEEELIMIINKAKDAKLITSLIIDNGLTEFNGIPTITCGAIGPAYPEELNNITGHLKLL